MTVSQERLVDRQLRNGGVRTEPLGVDLVVGAVGADFVEGLVKTGAQLVVALAPRLAAARLKKRESRSPTRGCGFLSFFR